MPRASNTRPIVLLTNTHDLGADDVVRRVAEHGYSLVRLNADLLDGEAAPTWRIGEKPSLIPGTVWWRQFERPYFDEAVGAGEIDDLLVKRLQWRQWLALYDLPGVPWVNDLWAARRAENKIVQLRVAEQVGFRVPETTVTNDAAVARAFASLGPAVVKSLGAAYYEFSGHAFVYTRALTEELLGDESAWFDQPLVVQRRVVGDDIRVVVVGDACFGARCRSGELDWRTAKPTPAWERAEIPSSVEQSCRDYLRALGLRYAAFDFLDEGTTWCFLEANQAGEWSFLERQLNLGIADALSRFLITLSQGET